MHEWAASFSGPKLRWEALGIIFGYWSFGSFNYSGPKEGTTAWTAYGRTASSDGPAWHASRRRLDRASPSPSRRATPTRWSCTFSTVSAYSNPTSPVMLVSAAVSPTPPDWIVSGDGRNVESLMADPGLAVARCHGEMISTAMFVGMHAESPTAPCTPTAASEARRRCFGMIFVIDKVAATFTGRPPMVKPTVCLDTTSSRHSQQGIHGRARSSCCRRGEAGFRRLEYGRQDTHSTTMLRARANLAYVRDAILEASLGHIEGHIDGKFTVSLTIPSHHPSSLSAYLASSSSTTALSSGSDTTGEEKDNSALSNWMSSPSSRRS